MIETLLISLILTICIELFISVLIGIRRIDVITVITVNVLTNPVVVFIANVIKIYNIIFLYWVIVIIMELIVIVVEGKIYEKILNYKKISGFILSCINNIISFGIGLIIAMLLNQNVDLKIESASAFFSISEKILSLQDLSYDLKQKSTNEVYEDIINGKADVIIATMPSEEQKEMIEKSGVKLEFKVIYREPLAIFLNASNHIDNLNIKQLQEIYYSDNCNFNTYQLEPNNGSQTCFETIVKNNKLGEKHYEIKTMPEIIDTVALDSNRNWICILFILFKNVYKPQY